MAISNGRNDLLNYNGSMFFFKTAPDSELIKKLSAGAEFSHQIVSLFIFVEFVELDDVWVIKPFQNFNFFLESLHLVIIELVNFQNFDGPHYLGSGVLAFSDLAVSAIALRLPNQVVILEKLIILNEETALVKFDFFCVDGNFLNIFFLALIVFLLS